MLIPMVLANRKKAFTIAAGCTVCSVLGGIQGLCHRLLFLRDAGRDGSARTYHWRTACGLPRRLPKNRASGSS